MALHPPAFKLFGDAQARKYEQRAAELKAVAAMRGAAAGYKPPVGIVVPDYSVQAGGPPTDYDVTLTNTGPDLNVSSRVQLLNPDLRAVMITASSQPSGTPIDYVDDFGGPYSVVPGFPLGSGAVAVAHVRIAFAADAPLGPFPAVARLTVTSNNEVVAEHHFTVTVLAP